MTIHKSDRILVTGGKGFLGRFVCQNLEQLGYNNIIKLPGSTEEFALDLTKTVDVVHVLDNYNPQVIIHLAARVGGIGANKENPGSFFYENMAMGLNLIEESRKIGCKKFILISTVCSYPKFTPVPFKEEDIWNGYPEETNAPYGIAKKALMEMLQAYRKQYGFNGITLVPVNMYGPEDNFDFKTSHVIPALIKKIYDAQYYNESYVNVWGDGKASREFLYVEDCARAIVKALGSYDKSDPVNIGTGCEITISDLLHKISTIMGYGGDFIFDYSKPNGQPRRRLDISKAKKEFGFQAKINLDVGLRKTIDWFHESYILNCNKGS